MEAGNYCMGCMGKREQGSICPYCGYHYDTPPESPLFLSPGTTLHEKYLIGRVLGHGGFGITYLAFDLTLHVKLAIKEFLPRDMATRSSNTTMVTPYTGPSKEHFEYGLEKFLEEARALARFDESPGIVSVKDFFRANETAYFVMNYVEGITFKEYLKSHGDKIEYDKALRILMPVMDALREVHQTGLLHRDISPDNIYIAQEGRIKLLDFGAARNATGEHSQSLSVMLKAGYAPEEQYRSKGKQGPWTDIYAVGATLYRAITGNAPLEALDRMNEDALEPPSRMGIKIPPHAEQALLKAMSVKAGDRFQEMKTFQQALMGELTGDIVNTPPGEMPQESKRSFTIDEPGEQKTTTPNNLPKKDNRYVGIIIGVAAIIIICIMLFKNKSEPTIATKTATPVAPAPETATPVAPAPETATPVAPAPETVKPVAPAPETVKPVAPAPKAVKPAAPVPEVAKPAAPAPQDAAPEYLYYEIRWNFYNTHYEGLMELKGNSGNIRVKLIDRNTEETYDLVDQSVTVRTVDDGTEIYCSNPISHEGRPYTADNFKIYNDGHMIMKDNEGNWSEQIDGRQITNKYQFEHMLRKYRFK